MTPIQSMTGFGRAEKTGEQGSFAVEVRSVNHRFLDPRVHLPRELASLEIPLLKTVKARLARGKVEVSVRWTPAEDYVPRLRFNPAILARYRTEIANLAPESGEGSPVSLEFLLGLPGVSDKEAPETDQTQLFELAGSALSEALDALVAEREREGQALRAEFHGLLDGLKARREEIAARRDEVVEAYRAKFQKKAEEWAASASVQIDAGRLETEVLLFAERSDISEELARLAAHLTAFRENLEGENAGPRGKTMEFLTQEILRETNTIASKARDTAIASLTVELKDEIEKIREQAMNVE